MVSWGDVNARLNRLVRDGVIARFSTNLASRSDVSELSVTVVPGPAAPEAAGRLTSADALRSRVAVTLDGIAQKVTVTIAPATPAGPAARNSAETLGR